MEITHYHALFISYGAAVAAWFSIARLVPSIWPKTEPTAFAKPWREVGWAFVAVIAIILVGQVYQKGIRLPNDGSFGGIFESVNQLIIFCPVVLMLLWRRQPFSTVWLSGDKALTRLAAGIGIALFAILIFTMVRTGSDSFFQVVGRTYHYQNLAHLVQVFMEDITIAYLFVRFRAVLKLRGSIILVAALFAAGHIPTMISEGYSFAELSSLLLDASLGIGLVYTVQRSGDILWFWCLHFAMDMMQFYAVP